MLTQQRFTRGHPSIFTDPRLSYSNAALSLHTQHSFCCTSPWQTYLWNITGWPHSCGYRAQSPFLLLWCMTQKGAGRGQICQMWTDSLDLHKSLWLSLLFWRGKHRSTVNVVGFRWLHHTNVDNNIFMFFPPSKVKKKRRKKISYVYFLHVAIFAFDIYMN